MANFTAGASFTDGVTNDVTAAKLNALIADAVPTSNLSLNSTTGTIANFTSSTANITLGTIPTLTAGTTTGTAAIFTSGTITTGLIPTLTTGTTTSTNDVVTNGTITNLSATTSTFLGTITGSTNVVNIGSGQIYKDSSGNVGIGGTPSTLLHLQSTSPSLRIQAASGNSGALDFYRTASVNSGQIASESTNALVFSTNTSTNSGLAERLRIDSSGNVGIGVVTPISSLHIKNATPVSKITLEDSSTNRIGQIAGGSDGSGGYLAFSAGNNGGSISERLRIDSSGNVGIGTASPSTRLDVAGGSGVRVNEDGIGTKVVRLRSDYAGVGPAIQVSTNDPLLLLTNNTERLRIDSSGLVGIGTSAPSTDGFSSYKNLVISGSGNTGLTIKSGTGSFGGLVFNRSSGGVQGFVTYDHGTDSLQVGAGATERLRIDSSGRVGIGTTSPVRQLTLDHASNPEIGLYTSGTERVRLSTGGTAASQFCVDTGGTERLRITSVGEVYIAGVNDQGAYNLQVNGTGVWGAGAYVNGSDERLKENIQDITSGLDVVEKLRPVSFQYKEEYTADRSIQSGFIAQDLLVALEGKNYLEGVVSQGPTYYNVAYQNLIPILAKAIQELKAENDSLKARIEILEAA